ncbi:DUF523 domain-containing protein [Enterococcus cecorum]|uniref:DUF523 domain-containing protein n=1 Tax=Enterococcus cecorum TaxID=44008 RepID=UPI001FAE35FF|nr:DUF523 domain-containing protein [Enterococcus cecorum]MCJ0544161.1 DUF523 domain-containing protein [Enterococcus cecorum]MCJ0548993.1 DUF523 domain-containing protein [Enterococcus cecorum]
MIGISACLGGVCCRYDGRMQKINLIKELIAANEAVLVCPEVMGGLPIPRVPAEIVGGDGFDVWQGKAKVINQNQEDVTESFKQGARVAYEKLQAQQVTTLILKERSPSCGKSQIYDGTFSGTKQTGVGVATAYFIQKGMQVYSEADLPTLCSQRGILLGD